MRTGGILLGVLMAGLVTAGCLAVTACAAAEQQEGAPGGTAARPNVVFLLLDAMRYDRLGATRNNIPITPFLNEFATRGACFTRATSPSAWTRPSILAMFTGQYPDVFQGTDDMTPKQRYVIPESSVTLPEWFKRAGYDTWAFQTNANGCADFGFAQGFDDGHFKYLGVVEGDKLTDEVIAASGQWTEPFFSYVHYLDIHSPYTPAPEYAEIFGPQSETTAADEESLSSEGYGEFLEDTYVAWVNGTPPKNTPLSAGGVEAMRYRYDAELRGLDHHVSRLVAHFQAKFPNTIFVVVADHGECLLDRGMLGHGAGVFEELTHVPLILQGPGITPGKRAQPVEVLGVLPALAGLLGIAPESAWQGRDVLHDPGTAPVFAHTQLFAYKSHVRADSVMRDGLKLIKSTRTTTPQLFDLAADPGELTDLAAARPEDAARLLTLLDEHQEAVKQSGVAQSAQESAVSQETVDQLESLGYVN